MFHSPRNFGDLKVFTEDELTAKLALAGQVNWKASLEVGRLLGSVVEADASRSTADTDPSTDPDNA